MEDPVSQVGSRRPRHPRHRSSASGRGKGAAPRLRPVVWVAVAISASLGLYVVYGAVPALNLPVREATAVGAAWLLSLLGAATSGEGALLSVGALRFAVVPDCTPVGPVLLLWGAMAAFPAPWRARLLGIALGAVVLTGLNSLRLVTLVYIGLAWPGALEVAHLLVWQSIMVLAAILLWVAWLRRYAGAVAA